MKIASALVTGGVGFVGTAIVRALLEKYPDCQVSVLDIQGPSEDDALPGVTYYRADITSAEETSAILDNVKPDLVIHTAGLVPSLDERYGREAESRVLHVNVEGTRNMLAAATTARVAAFIYTSSVTVLFDDLEHNFRNVDESALPSKRSLIYGESKAKAERLVLASSGDAFHTCALRPSMIIGPGDRATLPPFHSCIAKGETPYIIGSGDNLCDFTYVDNVADAHVLAAESLLSSDEASGEAFFITNGEPVPFRDFCLAVWAEFGHCPPCQVRIPEGLAWFAGCIAECVSWFTGTTATLSRGSVKDAVGVRYASIDKAAKLLGYRPRVGLAEGLRRSCKAYKEQLEYR
ncbi:MAG: hypothetical protein M1832_002299 [Thelocarpon impressellum]|nr:MAG: hypothetical protein M1832_002299 [Thelocarpon impressellum]